MMIYKLLALAAALGAASVTPAAAQTAFYTGERVTGLTKLCYYDAMGSPYSITVRSTQLCPMSIQARVPPRAERPSSTPRSYESGTTTALYRGEETSGLTKICYYDTPFGAYTHTVSSVALCPLTLRVNRR